MSYAGVEARRASLEEAFVPPPLVPRRLARRGQAVRIAKYALPVMALALLSSIALWPELSRTIASGRVTWHRLAMVDASNGMMVSPRYRGVDDRSQPYMVTAASAHQAGPERVDLVSPRGDVTLSNGAWVQVRGRTGVFMQHANQLDLAGDVTLYRQDGTIMTSATATLDMKKGAAASDDFTHAEGPFGTLDAQGFTAVDKGGVIQFRGPARLVLNGNK